MKIGSLDISKILVGSVNVSKVMLGTQVVWAGVKDISDIVFVRTIPINGQSGINGLKFKPDGLQLYICSDSGSGGLLQKTLVTAWDISNFSNRDYSVKTVETYKLCLIAHTVPEWGEKRCDQIKST